MGAKTPKSTGAESNRSYYKAKKKAGQTEVYATKVDKALNSIPLAPQARSQEEFSLEIQQQLPNLTDVSLFSNSNNDFVVISRDSKPLSHHAKKTDMYARQLLAKKNPYGESKNIDPQVSFTLKEYMDVCGLKDIKEARKNLREALQELSEIKFVYDKSLLTKKDDGNAEDDDRFTALTPFPYVNFSRATAEITFEYRYAKALCTGYSYPLPDKFFAIPSTRHPHAASLMEYIYHLKGVRDLVKKPLYVGTLLEKTNFDVEAAKSSGRLNEKLRTPFERDMDALSEHFSWHYLNKDAEPLTDAELDTPWSIDDFLTLRVAIAFKDKDDEQNAAKKTTQKTKPKPKKEADDYFF